MSRPESQLEKYRAFIKQAKEAEANAARYADSSDPSECEKH